MTLKELLEKIGKNPEGQKLILDNYLEEFIPEQLLKSGTLQEAFGVTPYEMESLYTQGYELYQKGDYEKAREVFRWLVILGTFDKSYWLAFGACQKLLKEYENALKSYAIVSLLDGNDPTPHFHAYECYRELKNTKDANLAWDEAQKRGNVYGRRSCVAK